MTIRTQLTLSLLVLQRYFRHEESTRSTDRSYFLIVFLLIMMRALIKPTLFPINFVFCARCTGATLERRPKTLRWRSHPYDDLRSPASLSASLSFSLCTWFCVFLEWFLTHVRRAQQRRLFSLELERVCARVDINTDRGKRGTAWSRWRDTSTVSLLSVILECLDRVWPQCVRENTFSGYGATRCPLPGRPMYEILSPCLIPLFLISGRNPRLIVSWRGRTHYVVRCLLPSLMHGGIKVSRGGLCRVVLGRDSHDCA